MKHTLSLKHLAAPILALFLLALLAFSADRAFADSKTILSATSKSSGVVLQWNVSPEIEDPSACVWNVYRSLDGETWEIVHTGNYADCLHSDGTMRWTDKNALSGVACWYIVCPGDGTSELEQSNALKVSYVGWRTIQSASVGSSGITLKWKSSDRAATYFVLRQKNGTWKKIGSTADCSFTDSAVSAGKTYHYAVYYVEENGTEQKKLTPTGTTVTYCATPDVSLRNSASGVKLTWNSDPNAALYRVRRKEAGGSWKTLGYTDSASYIDRTAKSNVTYSYAVRCMSADKKQVQSSYKSQSIRYIAAPTITAVHAGSNGLTVKWKAVTGASTYRVLYKTDSGWKKLADTTDTSYLDTKVDVGASRVYIVRCLKNGSYVSGYHDGVTGKRLKSPSIRFSAENGKLMLSWDKVSKAEKYRVYRYTDGEWKKVGDTTACKYRVTANPGKIVRYAVRCVSKNGKSWQSTRIAVTGRYTDYTFRSAKQAMAGCGYFTKSGNLTDAQKQAILRYMNAYYSSIGSFQSKTDGVFCSKSTRTREATVWNSVMAVRKKAIEDLSLTRYRFTLKVVSLEKTSDQCIKVKVLLNTDQQFRDIPVLSQEYGSDHSFTLKQSSSGKWLVSSHSSECSPYYHFRYDAENDVDLQLAKALKNIEERQATWGKKTGKSKACDHPYDREKAIAYMMKWIATRNPDWFAYDDYGGNCMNFASQVLYAGGIHQTGQWYWRGAWNCSNSWVNVGSFTDYAKSASSQQLYCSTNANYYTGDVGDLVLIGIQDPESHATIISDVIRDEQGRTVDYLLSCNTTNLKNFPASAYHYTNQRLIRIYGWND